MLNIYLAENKDKPHCKETDSLIELLCLLPSHYLKKTSVAFTLVKDRMTKLNDTTVDHFLLISLK